MCHESIVQKSLLILSVLLMVLFNQPMKAHANADLHREKGHDVKRSHDKRDDHGHDGDKRDEHQDEHHGK